MAKLKHDPNAKPTHFIKEWRKHRGLSQQRLADRLDVTKGAISQLEQGRVGYTQPMLEALAYALMCEPADLIMRNPLQTEPIWSIWDKVPESERPRVIEIMQTFTDKKTGT